MAGRSCCSTDFPMTQGVTTTSLQSFASAGADVIVPYLRGYGPTRFADEATPRSGQQAALAADVRDLIAAYAYRNS
jgi:pimeloyl-ACP methyl ester carboxylesterase